MSEEKATISVVQGTYEPCEECGAPLDPQQRYCVNCAARRGNGANPSSRYFAAMSKKARRPLTRPPAKAGPGSRAAAVGFFALLPIAVALGVVVGRSDSGSSDNEALLQALRQQEAATASTAAPTTAATATGKNAKKAKSSKTPAKGEGKVVAQTKNGTVHAVTGFKASTQKTEEDTQIVAENPEQTGDNYIKAQQNLPDVTVIGGDPGSAPAPSSGVEP
ncbi:MAG TPA: hypothetical protein VGO36_02510 [Solirubrobacterales bacterium]|jgi:hypothetical protein|nr:hypothetical protein [Solirubrobacterales bacterium]